MAAIERAAGGATEMMLVAGFSGTGKSATVREVHKPTVAKRRYFISGKFDRSLRTFSRSDADNKTLFYIHHGTDSTLLIFAHRLNPRGSHPGIKVIEECGNLPLV